MTITVHNSNELHTALKNATGGETIALAKGDYGWIGVSYKNFDVPVTITSADPDSPTTLPERMIVQHSSGVIFKNLDFTLGPDVPESWAAQVIVRDSSDIQFVDVSLAGHITQPGEGISYDDFDPMVGSDKQVEGYAVGTGINIRSSSDIVVDNLDITDVRNGLTLNGVDGITVKNSHFHEIRNDGIDFTQSSNVVIEDNLFDNFKPFRAVRDAKDYGDHGDFIQYWATNATESMDNVEIKGNVMVTGAGGIMQAIFGRSSTDGSRTRPDDVFMTNFSVHDNLILGTSAHGITLGDTQHTKIYNNTVLPSAPLDHLPRSTDGIPKINVTTAAWQAEDGSWVESNGIMPKDIEVYNNIKVSHDIGLPKITLAEQTRLGIVPGENTTLSNNPDDADWWGNVFPELIDTSSIDIASLIGRPEGGVQSLAPWLIEAAANVSLSNESLVNGTSGDDVLVGVSDRPLLAGYKGDDVLIGGEGIDTLYGGDGSDTMTGGAKGDLFSLKGSTSDNLDIDVITDLNFAEHDTIAITEGVQKGFFTDYYDSSNKLAVFGWVDTVLDSRADVTELLMHPDIDGVTNQYGDLDISFDFNRDQQVDYVLRLKGYYELDIKEPVEVEPTKVEGGSGADNLQGSDEDEVINGFGGNDEINGGAGSDTITGGNGADRFDFDIEQGANTDKDVITDFSFDEGDQLAISFEDSFNFMDRISSRYLRFEDGGDTVVIRNEKALMELTRTSANAEISTDGDSITLTFDRENDGHAAAGTEYELMLKGDIVEEITPFL